MILQNLGYTFLLENEKWLLGSWIFLEVQKIHKALNVFNMVLSCDKPFLVREDKRSWSNTSSQSPCELRGKGSTGVRAQNPGLFVKGSCS